MQTNTAAARPPVDPRLRDLIGAIREASSPRETLLAVERLRWLPGGTRERVHGWGLMGQPFASGHVLGLRRWASSSIGPAYTTVWHRSPDGRWTFWSDQNPEISCNRYAGEHVDTTATTPIQITWPDADRFRVTVPEFGFRWDARLVDTVATRMLNAVALRMPEWLRRNRYALRLLGPMAGGLLGVGPLGITGGMPNGQQFIMAPYYVWRVDATTARIGGTSFGPPGALPRQERIGDFRIPQRGVAAIGSVHLDPLDPTKHSTRTTRTTRGTA